MDLPKFLNPDDPYWDEPAPAKNPGEGGGLFRSLSHDDLQMLRAVVRRVHAKRLPGVPISARVIDQMIESIGSETAERMIRAGRDIRLRS